MGRSEIRSALIEAGLADLADSLIALARPAIRATTKPVRWHFEHPPVGASRLGGKPDLPPEAEWPGGLCFIGQVNLRETAGYDTDHLLPKQGMLYFFYNARDQPTGLNPADKGQWAVLFYDGDPARLSPRQPADGAASLNPSPLVFSHDLTMPPLDSRSLSELGIGSPQASWNQYRDFMTRAFGSTRMPGFHWLLGHPAADADMRVKCEMASHGIIRSSTVVSLDTYDALAGGADEWEPLFQVNSDANAGILWSGPGLLYFWIPIKDLRKRRFDRVWAIREDQ